jgi:hypothetical protein
MKKIVALIIFLTLQIPLWCYGFGLMGSGGGQMIAGGVGDGLIGWFTAYVNPLGLANNTIASFEAVVTATPGNVRYAHFYQGAGCVSGRTICISLQQNSDGGTVYLHGSAATTGASAWLNIDCSDTFELQDSTVYRLCAINTGSTEIVGGYTGNYGDGDIRNDTGVTYSSCGQSWTDDEQRITRHFMIVFDNQSGDPE